MCPTISEAKRRSRSAFSAGMPLPHFPPPTYSARTGVRLIGPKPQWARRDGGEAGLHPSNIHDNAYAIGAIDFTGDMPIILGPDGPSCGGFVCPATIPQGELWKMGQLKPGDKVRFRALTAEDARIAATAQDAEIESLLPARKSTVGRGVPAESFRKAQGSEPVEGPRLTGTVRPAFQPPEPAILHEISERPDAPAVCYRPA